MCGYRIGSRQELNKIWISKFIVLKEDFLEKITELPNLLLAQLLAQKMEIFDQQQSLEASLFEKNPLGVHHLKESILNSNIVNTVNA